MLFLGVATLRDKREKPGYALEQVYLITTMRIQLLLVFLSDPYHITRSSKKKKTTTNNNKQTKKKQTNNIGDNKMLRG